jgi:LuxR family maltose regulon positive regulatory protein
MKAGQDRALHDTRLLATKLHPRPARANLVARPRLCRLLDEGRAASLILVSAPAGFGKTTLLAEWLGHTPHDACWLSLDAGDNDPARFLSYVIATLEQAVPGVAGDLVELLRSPEPPAAEAVLAALMNELALAPADLFLVLDDYHVITSPAVNGAVTFLLENLPPNLHLIISSRADPPIPIARLRSQGQVVEIRADELRFTPDEAAAFLTHTMGLTLTPEQVAVLDERAEGWIAGLQMAALSMRGREDVDAFIQAFAGTNRFILDFLVEEVLAREPEEIQTFLLQTALLTRLSGPLCDAVTDRADSQQMLERLERCNLFVVPLDDDRCWYRYHHLFADLLQARLYQTGHEPVARLRAHAAEWCERNGQVAEAVSYALAAHDYARAARLVARYWGDVANDGEIETAWSWLAALPEDVVRNSAPLSVACCWTLWLKGEMSAIETHLLNVEAALDCLADPEASDADDEIDVALPAQVAALRSIVARYNFDFATACAHAERALAQIPEGLPSKNTAQLRGLALLVLASACDGAGDLERAVEAYAETIRGFRLGRNAAGIAITYRMVGLLRLLGRLCAAEAACRAALRYSEEQGLARLPATGILHLALAEVLVERNELATAEDHLARAHELGRRSGRLDAVRNAAPALARLRLVRGDVGGALDAIDEAVATLGEPPPPLAHAELLALKARILLRQSALDAASYWADEALRLAGRDRGQTGEMVALAALRVQVARSQPDEAVTLLTRALAAAEEHGWLGLALELRILRSLALWQQGAAREAEADLQFALALAEPEGAVRAFLDEGEPLAALLRKLARRPLGTAGEGCHGDSAPFLTSLLAAFGAPGEAQTPIGTPQPGRNALSPGALPLIEPLSDRELEVLRLMAAGLTNEQIARRLIIALGTVKAHIHHISGKLGAQNRARAVARAQELGLL